MGKAIYDAKKDPMYSKPYIDMDEERERVLSDGTRLPYRYMHGGFQNTNLKFSFCFPPKETYTGRFFQYLSPFPGPDEEMASLNKSGEDDVIAFSLQNGAYYVESNMGSKAMFGPSATPTSLYETSAAAAEYSRVKAQEIYGCGRPYGYVFGGSGGGYKTMACIENTNAWDGAAPYVIGSPVSLPNTITMHAQGQRCLRRVFGKIVDVLDAGGSGDMYKGLDEEEAFMLKELTLMGFPPITWFMEAEGRIDDGSLPVLAPTVKAMDPGYFEEFWKTPGYLGADPDGAAVRDRLQFQGVVKSVHIPGTKEEGPEIDGRNGVDNAWKKMLVDGKDAWIELEEVPEGDLYLGGVNITFESGDAKDRQLLLGDIKGNCLVIGMCYGKDDIPGILSLVKPGDKVSLDNSDYIAVQSYYRHQVPADPSFHAWDQFRDENGKPKLPQRNNVLGYSMTGVPPQDGDIQGKVIITQALMDESTCPWCGDWYRNKIRETKGTEEDVRLYYMDRCLHNDEAKMESNMVINYHGALRQAILDLSDWVERGIEPRQSTVYQRDGGLITPAAASGERKGMQAVVSLLAEGKTCAHVRVGEMVRFTVHAEVPEGAGRITAVDYDPVEICRLPGEKKVFLNSASFTEFEQDGRYGADAEFSYTYDRPGTYFASVRVKSNRKGDASDIFTQVKNLARVRVVVE